VVGIPSVLWAGFYMPDSRIPIFGTLDVLSKGVLPPKYPSLPQVIAQRTTPGILILTASSDLVYINAEGREVLSTFAINLKGCSNHNMVLLPIPELVTDLCSQLKQMIQSYNTKTLDLDALEKKTPTVRALSITGSEVYSFRAFFLCNNQRSVNDSGYILVLIERVSPTKKLNMIRAAEQYKLSKREIEVVELLIRGYKNKEIAEKLCVCVYTVEDHFKKIMKKVRAGNRTGISAKLLEAQ
jgi:DNA-binding NarL/FixJ family response regulator